MLSLLLYTGVICLSRVLLIHTLTLPSVRNPSSFSELTPPANKNISGHEHLDIDSPAVRPLNLPDPFCDGGLLGYDMNRYSCLEAMYKIPSTPKARIFGDRAHGDFDVQLPRRFSSRE